MKIYRIGVHFKQLFHRDYNEDKFYIFETTNGDIQPNDVLVVLTKHGPQLAKLSHYVVSKNNIEHKIAPVVSVIKQSAIDSEVHLINSLRSIKLTNLSKKKSLSKVPYVN